MTADATRAGTARFAVLDCEDAPKWQGHVAHWIDPLRRPGETWDVFRAWAGELPPSVDAYQGVILTGSGYSVNDPLPWLPPLFRFLLECVTAEDGSRVVGACFGHQAVARALGGLVGINPSGSFVFGTEQIALEPRFRDAWYGADLPPRITLLASHAEQVLELPPGALQLARSSTAEYEAFAIGSRALAVQSHPELTRKHLLEIILPTLRETGRMSPEEDARALASLEQPTDSAVMMRVIRRFLDGRPA